MMKNPVTRLYAALAVAAIVVAAFAYHCVTVAGLEGDVATLNGKLSTLKASNLLLTGENKTCRARVGSQNAAIENARTEAENRAAVASLAVAEADRRARAAEAVAAAILARPMPKPGDECGSLEVLINEEIDRRAK